MKSLITVLGEIVDPFYITTTVDKNNRLKLEESNDGINYHIYIDISKGIDRYLLINLDKKEQDIHPFLKAHEAKVTNLRKCCDYLLFCEVADQVYVFPIELKSKDATGWKRQVRAGIAFAQYLIAFAEVKDYCNYDLHSSIKYRCILFKQGNSIKRKTGVDPYSIEDIYKYKFVQKSFKKAPKPFKIAEFFDPRNAN
jgi:hypothetical protein